MASVRITGILMIVRIRYRESWVASLSNHLGRGILTVSVSQLNFCSNSFCA